MNLNDPYVTISDFAIFVANETHAKYAQHISKLIEESARIRNTGIAKRSPEYLITKMKEGKAIIALHHDERLAGFCYIETWTHGKYVANSGLIVVPEFRNRQLAKHIKQAAFDLSRKKYPHARIFSITTSHAVMKMNAELGYKPVPFSELTSDTEFWDGCRSCRNYDILTRNNRKNCLCTGLIYDPQPRNSKPASIIENRLAVLAFSGGLDTAYCAKYLSRVKGLDVHSVCVNTGAFSGDELSEIEDLAYRLGVKRHVTLDETNRYYQQCIKYLIFGNVLRHNTYPLSVSSERVFQALAVVDYARQVRAGNIAHGSSGAGNDQVRFDTIFHILAPDIEVLTPVRDEKRSRHEEIEFLKNHGFEQDWEKTQYSINKGIWGTTIAGRETLTSYGCLPEKAFPTQMSQTVPLTIDLVFKQGELLGINNETFDHPVQVIRRLEEIAGPYALGRDMHVGDAVIGIKGRIGFEAAAPLIIIKAHHALEKHTLTKWQLYWKDQLANWYGTLLHEGQFLDPVMRNIETFLESTQKNVSGSVSVCLTPSRFQILGVNSPHDLMSPEVAMYGEMNNAWTAEDVKGFSKILSNQTMIYHKVNKINETR